MSLYNLRVAADRQVLGGWGLLAYHRSCCTIPEHHLGSRPAVARATLLAVFHVNSARCLQIVVKTAAGPAMVGAGIVVRDVGFTEYKSVGAGGAGSKDIIVAAIARVASLH